MTNIYRFTDDCEDKPLLGNKGANLVTMTRLGLRVPPGFVVSIDAFKEYRASNTLPLNEIDEALAWLSDKLGRSFDDGLTVSVRSSAPVSMPGMMDTVLNVASREEVLSCLKTVFGSWDNPRANEYRRLHDISADIGTSAVVQSMVMGNRDEISGTGVIFSRNPSTGARGLFGEYLPVAQGEDLVSGVRTPQSIDALKNQMPDVYEELEGLSRDLEQHFHDMQDVEFTVESGNLFMLQTRSGKRSGQAAVKIAVDMVEDGLLTRNEALLRITPDDIRSLLHNRIQFPERHQAIARGPQRRPRRSLREGRLRPPGGRLRRQDLRRRNPRPPRDQPRRHPGHRRCRWSPHLPRRSHFTRRHRHPGNGQALCLWRRRSDRRS